MYSDCVCGWKMESKIVCALRGGSNFVAGFNRSGVPSITCLAHSLQHVIHDGVLAQKDVQDLLAAGRKALQTLKCCFPFTTENTGSAGAKSVCIVPRRANQVKQELLHVEEACGAAKSYECF